MGPVLDAFLCVWLGFGSDSLSLGGGSRNSVSSFGVQICLGVGLELGSFFLSFTFVCLGSGFRFRFVVVGLGFFQFRIVGRCKCFVPRLVCV